MPRKQRRGGKELRGLRFLLQNMPAAARIEGSFEVRWKRLDGQQFHKKAPEVTKGVTCRASNRKARLCALAIDLWQLNSPQSNVPSPKSGDRGQEVCGWFVTRKRAIGSIGKK
jgi:hypothetical protein